MEEKKKFSASDAMELAKIGIIALGAWKIAGMLSKIGKDTTTGQGTGTAQMNCDPKKFEHLTKSITQFNILADAIEAAVWGGFFGQFTEADQAMANALMQVNTDDDVQMMICAYGVRGKGVIIEEHFNLPQTVQKYLDEDWKGIVNEDYHNKGINIYWP